MSHCSSVHCSFITWPNTKCILSFGVECSWGVPEYTCVMAQSCLFAQLSSTTHPPEIWLNLKISITLFRFYKNVVPLILTPRSSIILRKWAALPHNAGVFWDTLYSMLQNCQKLLSFLIDVHAWLAEIPTAVGSQEVMSQMRDYPFR